MGLGVEAYVERIFAEVFQTKFVFFENIRKMDGVLVI